MARLIYDQSCLMRSSCVPQGEGRRKAWLGWLE
jgi:hypothetical protein